VAIDPKTTTELLGALLAEQTARIEKLEKRPALAAPIQSGNQTLAIHRFGF
jgi:hypothetical protein